MAIDIQTAETGAPEFGQLAVVRGRRWVVADVIRSELPADITGDVPSRRQHLVSLISVEDDATGEELMVIWELEPGASSVERPDLPEGAPGAGAPCGGQAAHRRSSGLHRPAAGAGDSPVVRTTYSPSTAGSVSACGAP